MRDFRLGERQNKFLNFKIFIININESIIYCYNVFLFLQRLDADPFLPHVLAVLQVRPLQVFKQVFRVSFIRRLFGCQRVVLVQVD